MIRLPTMYSPILINWLWELAHSRKYPMSSYFVSNYIQMIISLLNALRLGDTFIQQWTGPALVQQVACRLLNAEPFPGLMPTFFSSGPFWIKFRNLFPYLQHLIIKFTISDKLVSRSSLYVLTTHVNTMKFRLCFCLFVCSVYYVATLPQLCTFVDGH